eukprot:CAMPEP_0182909218 /NCGR_PEP_ID=MMETSP0034_2-20130328/35635_1 /TAXON_ID=156128 /ORGANISM="Nephroselmis pyriformis, Strain CCMP717" /LENGTH=182 /DNA_ID=CAMNT_0025045459 /DNA_START=155 /DNA_END=699 /DNA_ORIENTATION=+
MPSALPQVQSLVDSAIDVDDEVAGERPLVVKDLEAAPRCAAAIIVDHHLVDGLLEVDDVPVGRPHLLPVMGRERVGPGRGVIPVQGEPRGGVHDPLLRADLARPVPQGRRRGRGGRLNHRVRARVRVVPVVLEPGDHPRAGVEHLPADDNLVPVPLQHRARPGGGHGGPLLRRHVHRGAAGT